MSRHAMRSRRIECCGVVASFRRRGPEHGEFRCSICGSVVDWRDRRCTVSEVDLGDVGQIEAAIQATAGIDDPWVDSRAAA